MDESSHRVNRPGERLGSQVAHCPPASPKSCFSVMVVKASEPPEMRDCPVASSSMQVRASEVADSFELSSSCSHPKC